MCLIYFHEPFVVLKPQMSLQHVPGDHVLFKCSLPISANPDTRCNLYFGEASRPILTTNTEWKRTWFCQFTVTTGDLLRHLRSVQQSDASCDYSLGRGPNSRSPRSDRYSLTGKSEKTCSYTCFSDPLKLICDYCVELDRGNRTTPMFVSVFK